MWHCCFHPFLLNQMNFQHIIWLHYDVIIYLSIMIVVVIFKVISCMLKYVRALYFYQIIFFLWFFSTKLVKYYYKILMQMIIYLHEVFHTQRIHPTSKVFMATTYKILITHSVKFSFNSRDTSRSSSELFWKKNGGPQQINKNSVFVLNREMRFHWSH